MITMSTTTEDQAQILADAETAGFGNFEVQDLLGNKADQPTTETPATPSGETPGVAAPGEGTGEGQTAAVSEPAGETHEQQTTEQQGQQPPKNKADKKLLKRVDKLTRDWRTEESRRQQVEQENEDLRRQLAEKNAAATKPAEATAPPQPAAEPQPEATKEPVPPARPKRADFQYDDDAYEEALTQYDQKMLSYSKEMAAFQADQKIADLRRQDAEQAVVDHLQAIANRGKEVYPDWDQVMPKSAENDVPFQPELVALITNSPVSEHLLYYLATNPEDAKYIAGLPSVQGSHQLGRLELLIEDQHKQGGPPPAARPPAQATAPVVTQPATAAPAQTSRPSRPAPIRPVNTGTSGPAPTSAPEFPPNSDGVRQYRNWRAQNTRK